ncbi:MAG: hypothetical protein ABI675_10855 [Chitinophagaceae bacterium]
MKTLKLILLFLLFPFVFHAQQTLTGLWIGSLSNDSTTVRNDQSYEIALTQYKEKVYGYSRSSFIVNDTLYYVLKRVKGAIDGDVCEIKDDEIVSFNFPGRLDKGVKVITTFRRNLVDSIWHLSGDWKTNKTKKFYAITGKIELKSETNYDKSKIFPHLEELKMDKEVDFYAASKKPVELNPPSKNIIAVNKKEVKKPTAPDITKQNKGSINETNETVVKKEETPQEETGTAITTKKSDLPATSVQAEQKKDVASSLSKPEIKKQELPVIKLEPVLPTVTEEAKTNTKKSDLVTTSKAPEEKKFIAETVQSSSLKITATAAAFVQERKTVAPQLVSFKSDSLELSLYDNGEIDGDTVSVLLNGELLMAKQGLKASAIKKTIYVQPGTEEITLVLYAENLGKYPPNTGLLVVHDGDDVYQLRFSADLQQNAAVVFRRKK